MIFKQNRVRVGTVALTLAVFFVLVVLLTRPPDDPFAAAAVVNPPFSSPTYGIQTFLWWDRGWQGTHLDWVKLMVFSHVKQVFAWEDLEILPGQWDFSRADEIVDEVERRGLKLVARLSDAPDWSHPSLAGHKDQDFVDAPPDDLARWGEYCGKLAGRYRGRIAAYQIWNEPNLSREWGGQPPDAAAYVALLRVCSGAIRAADPEAILISAGLAPTGNYDITAQPDDFYLEAMYAASFQQYIDVVGVHAPGFSPPQVSPDEAQADGGQRFFTFRRVEDIRRIMVRHGDAARQMAILEVGWTTAPPDLHPDYAWYAVSEELQARYLVEAYEYAHAHWQPWVGLMSAIYISDPSWTEADEEYWWGVTTAGGIVRPAYIALANMAKYCGDRVIPARAPDSPEALGLVHVDPCS